MVAERGIPDGGKYVGPPSDRRRSAVGPPSGRLAERGIPDGGKYVGPPSDRRRECPSRPPYVTPYPSQLTV